MPPSVRELDGSLGDFMSSVRSAFEQQFPPLTRGDRVISSFWIRDIFEDSVIVRDEEGNQLYRVAMTIENGSILFAMRDKWESVRLTYTREMVADQVVTEFRGNFPKEVPVRPGVDLAKLTEGDDNPFFLTLEISSEGRASANGLLHDKEFGETLVQQIMTDGAEGIMGHIKEENRVTDYPVSDIHWIGAVKENTKTWAKGYIPKTATGQREHYRILADTNGKAATSVYGRAVREFVDKKKGVWKAKGFELEQLDLAPYKRAALPPESGFVITSETANPDSAGIYTKEKAMDKLDVIRELSVEDAKHLPESVRQAILAGAPEVAVLSELRQALGLDDKADIKAAIVELKQAEKTRQQEAVKARVNELAADKEAGIKVESVRALVVDLVNARNPQTAEEVEAAYKAVCEMESVKQALAVNVQQTMGPRQSTPLQSQNGKSGKYFNIPEEK